ncbi:hypothetical protein ZWY2020_033686 [Hordeum vulgare]|nr:hypothetical protein ZWY2020_033686 [Hordeum vulgare]
MENSSNIASPSLWVSISLPQLILIEYITISLQSCFSFKVTSALLGCPTSPLRAGRRTPKFSFGAYLQYVKLNNLKFTLMISSPLLEVIINFATFNNISSSDGHRGIRGRNTLLPACCPSTISASMAFL